MNDQLFVNAYIRILNETLSEAFNKNLVMQAQLEVSKKSNDRTTELETKIKELTSVSTDNNALQSQLNALKSQLEQANTQANTKNAHVETFKRELVDARNIIKTQATEIESLKAATNKIVDAINLESQKKVDALNVEHRKKVDSLTAEIELLKNEVEELKSRKRKRLEKTALNTVESNFVAVSDTF
jgi:DNA repair exonuclease SbcCD ATPase subunit